MGIGAVVLAAGESRRFGTPKQLLEYQGENIVRRAARSAIEAGLNPVIVVLGANASSVEPNLDDLEVVKVTNEQWLSGQASSLALGIATAREMSCDAVTVVLADQPLVNSESLEILKKSFSDTNRVVASRYNDVLGAPAIFGSEHFADLLQMQGDHGAGKWLRSNSEIVTAVDLPEGAVDIDTPDDLKQLQQ